MPSPKRIVFVTTMLARGGAETQIFRVARSLHARGYGVDVLSLFPPSAYADELRGVGVGVEHLGDRLPRVGRALGVGVGRALLRLRPDVLVGLLFHANNVVRAHGRALAVPAVITSIRSESLGGTVRESTERAMQALRLDDRVVTNAATVQSALVRAGVVSPDRIETIGNGIELGDYEHQTPRERREVRRGLGADDATFVWLAVANFRPVKDHATMVEAFARAAEASGPPALLCVAGAGKPDAAWLGLVERLGLEDRVRVLGLREDVPSLLQAADGLVLSSKHEGLPNVVLEALAARCPVVSTDVGGVRELVSPGRSGAVVPPADPRALGDAMRDLMARPGSERRAMGQLGHDHIAQNYGLEKVTTRWEEAFDRAMFDAARRPMVRVARSLRRRR